MLFDHVLRKTFLYLIQMATIKGTIKTGHHGQLHQAASLISFWLMCVVFVLTPKSVWMGKAHLIWLWWCCVWLYTQWGTVVAVWMIKTETISKSYKNSLLNSAIRKGAVPLFRRPVVLKAHLSNSLLPRKQMSTAPKTHTLPAVVSSVTASPLHGAESVRVLPLIDPYL